MTQVADSEVQTSVSMTQVADSSAQTEVRITIVADSSAKTDLPIESFSGWISRIINYFFGYQLF